MPEISIVILTKNAGKRFKNVLSAVFSQKIELEKEFEVIIIDSGSKDKTLKVAHQFPLAKILEIQPEDFNFGKTKNLSLTLCAGRFIVFLSQDALPKDENWLENLVVPLEQDEKIVGSFSRHIPYKYTNLFQKYSQQFLYPEKEKISVLGDVFFSNVASAMKKEILEKYKFNEEMVMSEDQAWAKSVLEAGYQIKYASDSVIWHSHNYNFWTSFKRNFDSGMSLKKLNLIKKSRFLTQAPKYFFGEIAYLFKKRFIFCLLYLPFMMIYEGFRFWGFWLGSHYKILPLPWRQKFSLYKKNLE